MTETASTIRTGDPLREGDVVEVRSSEDSVHAILLSGTLERFSGTIGWVRIRGGRLDGQIEPVPLEHLHRPSNGALRVDIDNAVEPAISDTVAIPRSERSEDGVQVDAHEDRRTGRCVVDRGEDLTERHARWWVLPGHVDAGLEVLAHCASWPAVQAALARPPRTVAELPSDEARRWALRVRALEARLAEIRRIVEGDVPATVEEVPC